MSKLKSLFEQTGEVAFYDEPGTFEQQLRDYCYVNDFVFSEICCNKSANSVVVYFTIVKFTPRLNTHNKQQYRNNIPQNQKESLYAYLKSHKITADENFVDKVKDQICHETLISLNVEMR